MSQPSRAERRRSTRGGPNQPPPRRDPMVSIYIAFAIIIVLVLVGFGISTTMQNHARAAQAAFDVATPTPGPQPTLKPIQLKLGQSVGKPIAGIPTPNPKKGQLSDTKTGGQGQLVDGIPCQSSEGVVLHVHSHLTLYVKGVLAQIPQFIGMAPNGYGGCLYWMHTHDSSGVIHVEAGDVAAPQGGPYTLGMFFDIWGMPLGTGQIGPFKGNVSAFVNGQPYNGDPRAIPLRAHQSITLEVGTPVVPPHPYLVPKGD